MPRTESNPKQWHHAVEEIETTLKYRMRQKGLATFTSSHEIYGILCEEMKELLDAIHGANYLEPEKTAVAIRKELIDIAVGAIFGIVSIDAGKIDWL